MAGDRAWDPTRVEDILDALQTREGPLLPILHALQQDFGHVPEPAIPLVAARLNLSRAEVHGVVSFYHDFHTSPRGRHVLKVCRAEACQSMGAERTMANLLERLGLRPGETTADGRLTIESVYCLGLCATAPAAMLDGEPHGRLDIERLAALAATAA
jgi:formate dehydrogenase subunit gamma